MKEQQKKKAAPVLVVLILIVLVGAAGVVSFLINRYKPGTEYMAGNEYFNLTDENSVALIQNGELLEEQAVLIGGEPYAAYTYVESQLNSCFYWDEETKGILLTTSGGVQTLLPGAGIGLGNSLLYAMTNFDFLHLGSASFWNTDVMLMLALVKIPLFIMFTIVVYDRKRIR